MSDIRLKRTAICAGIGSLIATPAAVIGAERQGDAALDEVVVTATRVETSAQKTPIALTVYSGEDLAERAVRDIYALQSIDPSLVLTTNRSTPVIAIRGVQSTNTTEVGNPSVSVARDGFFVNRSYTLGLSFYDLDRIEVLKGPQGTLFGRNSTGGLVNIITAKPKLGEFSGYVSANIGDYDLLAGNGAVNLPVGDSLALRFSANGSKHDGYREVTGVNLRGDDDRSRSGRAQLYWKLRDNFDWLMGFQYDHIGGVGQVQAIGPLGQPFTGNPKSFLGYVPASLSVTTKRTTWTANLTDLPLSGAVTYTGGVDQTKYNQIVDSSGVNPLGVFTLAQFGNYQPVRTINHEVRYAGSTENGWTFQVGAFYFNEHNDGMRAGQIVAQGQYSGQYLITFNYDVLQSSRAYFGQASYAINDTMKLTLGARHSADVVSRVGLNNLNCVVAGIPPFLYGALGCTGTPPSQITTSDSRQADSKVTYRVGYDWQVTPDSLVYAKVDTGYKPGGFSTDPTQPNLAFGPETVTAYELGSKNRLAGGRVTLNGDVFYQTLDGFQATLPRTLGGGTINAGKTHTYGLEAQLVAAATDRTRFDLNTTFLHGRFDKGVQPVDDGSGVLVNIGGNTLPNAPDFVASAGIEQDFAAGEGKITLRLDGKYTSATYYDFVNHSDTRAPSSTIGNVSATYAAPGGNWTAQAYVKNFTDELAYGRITRTGLIASNTFQFQAPRTWGGQFTYRF